MPIGVTQPGRHTNAAGKPFPKVNFKHILERNGVELGNQAGEAEES